MRYKSIRVIISLASVMGWKLHQMDVKTAFLNGEIETSSNQKALSYMGKGLMCASSRKLCTGLSKHREPGMLGLTAICEVLDFPRA